MLVNDFVIPGIEQIIPQYFVVPFEKNILLLINP
jgi:hypothetical protein